MIQIDRALVERVHLTLAIMDTFPEYRHGKVSISNIEDNHLRANARAASTDFNSVVKSIKDTVKGGLFSVADLVDEEQGLREKMAIRIYLYLVGQEIVTSPDVHGRVKFA